MKFKMLYCIWNKQKKMLVKISQVLYLSTYKIIKKIINNAVDYKYNNDN